ncbi:hypothetical protein BU25DRAFT_115012 [Macroventuria anomochaeta]|uniref:Uncharacterized protein n=1 Tax=Macroventuria anomochaeta TaxID=301207 RepID=A0ACB6RUP9_9PLEO|nr:uncharacterized protein BU25DRAFT_115012 [Macroventuria anomochaeta]KAF2625518.1 hypothetical protein BU25DRAFT_115012 [Macroventuria anomochaeta]
MELEIGNSKVFSASLPSLIATAVAASNCSGRSNIQATQTYSTGSRQYVAGMAAFFTSSIHIAVNNSIPSAHS